MEMPPKYHFVVFGLIIILIALVVGPPITRTLLAIEEVLSDSKWKYNENYERESLVKVPPTPWILNVPWLGPAICITCTLILLGLGLLKWLEII